MCRQRRQMALGTTGWTTHSAVSIQRFVCTKSDYEATSKWYRPRNVLSEQSANFQQTDRSGTKLDLQTVTLLNYLTPEVQLNNILQNVTSYITENPPCCHICSSKIWIKRFNIYKPCVLYIGQAFRYSPQNAFYIFNQQIYLIIWYLLDRASLI